MWWAAIPVVVCILAGFLLASPLRVEIDYRRLGGDDLFALAVSWLKVFRLQVDMTTVRLRIFVPGRLPVLEATLRTSQPGRETRVALPFLDFLSRVSWFLTRYRTAVIYGLRRIRIRELVWHTVTGAREADKTGLLTGLVWLAKALVLTTAARYVRFTVPPRFTVSPNFKAPGSGTALRCVLDIRLGNLLVAALRTLLPLQ